MAAETHGYLRIATEEAFAPPELITMWRDMVERGTCDDPGFLSLTSGSPTWTPRVSTGRSSP